ncbi:MAG: AAA family ATPase [Archaeoglobaceae archaeon]
MKVDLSGALLNEFRKAEKEYEEAIARGDAEEAKKAAMKCARLLREIAKYAPNREHYLKLAEKWEKASDVKIRRAVSEDGKETEEDFSNYVKSFISQSKVTWNDIAGLDDVKRLMKETIVLSLIQKPESIQPWKGIMLFGPPGTGKTLLASACAGSLKATFFNVRTSMILSKYFGESSKIVSALYDVAREKSPSIVFIDEFDALTTRRDEMSEASRRMLATILAELDGFIDKKSERFVLTLAATNTPWDLDEAVLSRFSRRIYVPLPDKEAIKAMIRIHTKGLELKADLEAIAARCVEKFYSGRDVSALCKEATWNMVREMNRLEELANLPFEELMKKRLNLRPLTLNDFEEAFKKIKSPLTKKEIERYEKWAEEFGSR